MKAMRWFLIWAGLAVMGCGKVVDQRTSVSSKAFVPAAKPDLRIGKMEIGRKEADLAWQSSGVRVWGKYQYYRDAYQVSIRVPMALSGNLYLYAFKSYEKPSTLRLYIAQVYPKLPYRDSAFYGEVRWLNLQDYTLYRAEYANGKPLAGGPFGKLDFLQKRYDGYHEDRPLIPPNYPLNDTILELCHECDAWGTYQLKTENGFRRCLFATPTQKQPVPSVVYVFPDGTVLPDGSETAPDGFWWKTPLPWEWQVLEDDMGENAYRFLSTQGRTFYPPIAAF